MLPWAFHENGEILPQPDLKILPDEMRTRNDSAKTYHMYLVEYREQLILMIRPTYLPPPHTPQSLISFTFLKVPGCVVV